MQRTNPFRKLFAFVVTGLIFISSAFGQLSISGASTGSLNYRIARWYHFKFAAFTITFDDNTRLQYTHALPLLNEHNYKATFFVVTNWIGGVTQSPGWDTMNMVALQGHEIGSHSKNHADFTVLSTHPEYADSMRREFQDSRDSINANVLSQHCETFCWPGGSVDPAAIEASTKYYMACRGSNNYYNDSVPESYYNIFSQHIYHDTPLSKVNLFIPTILLLKGWLVERWHGFKVGQDSCGYEPVPIEIFRDHLTYVAQNEENLWIAPLHEVVKYTRERQSSVLTIIDTTSSGIVMSLTNNLPDTMFHYNVPLSLKVRLDGDLAKLIEIIQNNTPITITIQTENGSKYVYFDVVPNSGPINFVLTPNSIDDLQFFGMADSLRNYPNPFTNTTTVSIHLAEPEMITISIYDINGSMVQNSGMSCHAGRNQIVIDCCDLPSGLYLSNIESANKRSIFRMVVTH